MSNFTLNKPALNERPVPNRQQGSGLVRFPQTNGFPSRRSGLVDYSAFNNAIRAFYRQLGSFRSLDGKPIQTLGLTSCYQREGKSTVSESLASIAAENQRVLFIDANEPLLSIHNALRDEAADRQPTIDETSDLLRLLSSKFDLVVLDLPPLDSTKLLDWAPLLDGVVLIIESGRVRWQVAARGLELLEQAGSQVLGTVINKQEVYIPQWLYQQL